MGSDGDFFAVLSPEDRPAASPFDVARRACKVGVLVLAGGAFLFLPVKLCWMAVLLRIPCPGCGMTRATLALARGDIAGALSLHPLSPVVAPLVAIVLTNHAVTYIREGRRFGVMRVSRAVEWFAALVALALLGVWIARFAGFFGGPVSLA